MSVQEEASTSGVKGSQDVDDEKKDLYLTHQVTRLDTLAGLAIKYHVTVSDIKRANGLLSDTAMFAKDTLLIPTRSMPLGPEYSTWAGMIVAQYGRIPGDSVRPGQGTPALDQLQRYYGTGDTASEPCDFRPGEGDGKEGYASGTEIQLSELEGLGRSSHGGPACSVDYAGSRAGTSGEILGERLRRRRAGDACTTSAEQDGSECEDDLEGSPGVCRAHNSGWSGSGQFNWGSLPNLLPSLIPRTSGQHRRAQTQAGPSGRRESILERLKRAASQPSLAMPTAPSLARIGDAVVGSLADLPPLPPGSSSSSRIQQRATALLSPRRDKQIAKKD